ncbi:MAG: YndJ family transporter [Aquihabitans sp.]
MSTTTGALWTHPSVEAIGVSLAVGGVVAGGDRPLVDAVIVGGIGLVAPLSLGRSTLWTLAAVSTAAALIISPGPLATVLVLPALAAALGAGLSAASHLQLRGISSAVEHLRSLDAIALILGPAWACVAIGSLMASTAGVELFSIGEPIVRLTAVHYLYAGVGTLAVARRLRNERGPTRTTTLALAATGIAPPIVATGFVLGHPGPQIGGSILMTLGVWTSAAVLLARVKRTSSGRVAALRVAAGLTPWVPMVLAVAWATAQHVAGVPALSIPDMTRFHGLVNGIGFVLLGLLATRPPVSAAESEQMLLGVTA